MDLMGTLLVWLVSTALYFSLEDVLTLSQVV